MTKVLIIEDNPFNLEMARELLESAGMETVEAEDAQVGIQLAEETRPDLILMDMHLPSLNGYEACRILKSRPRTQNIPIVAFTALAMQEDKERAYEHGCVGVISKPVEVSEFANEVRTYLRQFTQQTTSDGEPRTATSAQKRNGSAPLSSDPSSSGLPRTLPSVLVIHPDAKASASLAHLVNVRGGQPWVSDTIDEALPLVQSQSPQLAILSVPRQDSDGLSRLIQLKQLPKLASVPVILLAPAGWEPDFVTQAFELGAADVVQEPWVAEQLTTRLSALWKVHELQTALQEQAQKTRRVRDELESFMMAASHDLQGPLRKALRFSEFIKASQGQTYRTQKDAKMLEGLERSLSQMQDLLSGLLALSRVKVRGNPFGLVDLAGIAQTITHEKNLQPGILEARNLPMIEGDAAQLKQLLEALIENALKFQPAGNTPVVRLDGYVDVASGTCKVIVSDNGIGFPEEEAEAIFQPFKRLHGVGKYPGAGLGLSLARKIAERHGGTLQAKAEPGSGANFILSLPSRQLFPE